MDSDGTIGVNKSGSSTRLIILVFSPHFGLGTLLFNKDSMVDLFDLKK